MSTFKKEITQFMDYLSKKWTKVIETEIDSINHASKLIFDSCKNDGRFYAFGSGHSHIVAEEIYIRAGGTCLC